MQTKEKTAPLPSIWATIAAGFDVTAKHYWLILIPVLLDIFLWLGPRLSLRLLIGRMVEFWQQEMVVSGLDVDLLLNADSLLEMAPRTNLFTSLSLPFLGVPALMVGLTPENTPLATTWIELDSAAGMVLLFLLFNILGLVLSAVYMTLTVSAIRQQSLRQGFERLGINWLKLVGLVLSVFIMAFIVYIPVVIVGIIITFLVNEALASIVILIGSVLVMWLASYLTISLVFAPHGIFVNGRPLLRAMLESFQLIRHHLLPTITLLLTIFLIGRTVDWLLFLADDGSWLTGFSLIGHAFVSTALLAATFIFYRDRHAMFFRAPETVSADTRSIGRSNSE